MKDESTLASSKAEEVVPKKAIEVYRDLSTATQAQCGENDEPRSEIEAIMVRMVSAVSNDDDGRAAFNGNKALFAVGTVVHVKDRTWAGRNDHGGAARILQVHHDMGEVKYDVKYILESGRKEKGVEECYISLDAEDDSSVESSRERRGACGWNMFQKHQKGTGVNLGKRWKKMSAEERLPYEEMAVKANADLVSSSVSKEIEEPLPSPSTPWNNTIVQSPGKNRSPRRGCGKCDVCLQEDCRECVNCLDMTKYGGPNLKRQKCIKKKKKGCLMMLGEEVEAESNTKRTKSSSKIRQRLKRESSAAPSSSRRRSDRLNMMRHQIESLLGITEDDAAMDGEFERIIVSLQLDKLEKVLSNDDKTSPYFAIAGKQNNSFVISQCEKFLTHKFDSLSPPITFLSLREKIIRARWHLVTFNCQGAR